MMKKILIGLFFLFAISAYCQNNIDIKLIRSRVILKSADEILSGNDYYKYLPSLKYKGVTDYTTGSGKWDSLARNAYDLALNGKITVYDPFSVEILGSEVRFPYAMSPKEVYQAFNWSDSTTIIRPYPPYEEVDTVFAGFFDPSKVVALDFYETWTINSKTMDIKKKIIALCPVLARYNYTSGEFLGLMPMFWIKM